MKYNKILYLFREAPRNHRFLKNEKFGQNSEKAQKKAENHWVLFLVQIQFCSWLQHGCVVQRTPALSSRKAPPTNKYSRCSGPLSVATAHEEMGCFNSCHRFSIFRAAMIAVKNWAHLLQKRCRRWWSPFLLYVVFSHTHTYMLPAVFDRLNPNQAHPRLANRSYLSGDHPALFGRQYSIV